MVVLEQRLELFLWVRPFLATAQEIVHVATTCKAFYNSSPPSSYSSSRSAVAVFSSSFGTGGGGGGGVGDDGCVVSSRGKEEEEEEEGKMQNGSKWPIPYTLNLKENETWEGKGDEVHTIQKQRHNIFLARTSFPNISSVDISVPSLSKSSALSFFVSAAGKKNIDIIFEILFDTFSSSSYSSFSCLKRLRLAVPNHLLLLFLADFCKRESNPPSANNNDDDPNSSSSSSSFSSFSGHSVLPTPPMRMMITIMKNLEYLCLTAKSSPPPHQGQPAPFYVSEFFKHELVTANNGKLRELVLNCVCVENFHFLLELPNLQKLMVVDCIPPLKPQRSSLPLSAFAQYDKSQRSCIDYSVLQHLEELTYLYISTSTQRNTEYIVGLGGAYPPSLTDLSLSFVKSKPVVVSVPDTIVKLYLVNVILSLPLSSSSTSPTPPVSKFPHNLEKLTWRGHIPCFDYELFEHAHSLHTLELSINTNLNEMRNQDCFAKCTTLTDLRLAMNVYWDVRFDFLVLPPLEGLLKLDLEMVVIKPSEIVENFNNFKQATRLTHLEVCIVFGENAESPHRMHPAPSSPTINYSDLPHKKLEMLVITVMNNGELFFPDVWLSFASTPPPHPDPSHSNALRRVFLHGLLVTFGASDCFPRLRHLSLVACKVGSRHLPSDLPMLETLQLQKGTLFGWGCGTEKMPEEEEEGEREDEEKKKEEEKEEENASPIPMAPIIMSYCCPLNGLPATIRFYHCGHGIAHFSLDELELIFGQCKNLFEVRTTSPWPEEDKNKLFALLPNLNRVEYY